MPISSFDSLLSCQFPSISHFSSKVDVSHAHTHASVFLLPSMARSEVFSRDLVKQLEMTVTFFEHIDNCCSSLDLSCVDLLNLTVKSAHPVMRLDVSLRHKYSRFDAILLATNQAQTLRSLRYFYVVEAGRVTPLFSIVR
jgi:hypothetical protein